MVTDLSPTPLDYELGSPEQPARPSGWTRVCDAIHREAPPEARTVPDTGPVCDA